MIRLILATRNAGKLVEMRRLLTGDSIITIPLAALEGVPSVEERGSTFFENAYLKARAVVGVCKAWALAEDSGLEIDALGGEPGINSARYGGPFASDYERVQLVLSRMVAVPFERRTARFRCAVCLVAPAGDEYSFEGVCEGHIAPQPRGTSGFGYDPIFIPEGHSRTFAELGSAVKDAISHRARALRQVAAFLAGCIENERSEVTPD